MQRFNPFRSRSQQPEEPEQLPDFIEVGIFSSLAIGSDLTPDWQPQTFRSIPQHTEYQLIEDEDQIVLQANAQASASGLIRRIQVDLNEYPILKWRWKVIKPVQNCDITQKETDACSARVFVTFGGQLRGLRALNYVWTAGVDKEQVLTSPVATQVKVMVLRNDSDPLETWIEEQRDLRQDFQQVFGSDPPKVSGVAVMTDSFRIREEVLACYGDILFSRIEG